MRVSVIIVVHNSGSYLARCFEALSKQTNKDFDVVLVDNNSTDGSVGRLSSIEFPRLTVVINQENLGFAKAANLAIERARQPEWIALLNPDAFPEPNWLQTLVGYTKRSPEYAAFSCRLLQANRPDVLDGAGDAYHTSGRVWRRGYGISAEGRYYAPEEVFSACAAAALYRRDAFEAVGGFDEEFFCYLEDVDLGYRLQSAGYRCLYVPDAIACHVGSAVTGKDSDFYVYHGHRNLVWTYVKNMPGALFWLYLPQHLLLNVFSILWFSVRGRWRVILKAKWDAIRGLPKMWKKREVIQARRVVGAWEIRKMMEKGWPHKR
jgi:GT2 family glycosyltransferase